MCVDLTPPARGRVVVLGSGDLLAIRSGDREVGMGMIHVEGHEGRKIIFFKSCVTIV